MMYKNPNQARAQLARLIHLRAYLIEGEQFSPAEIWFLDKLYQMGPVRKNDPRRYAKRRLIGLAKSLSLYPIPEWYLVQRRIKGEPLAYNLGDMFKDAHRDSVKSLFLGLNYSASVKSIDEIIKEDSTPWCAGAIMPLPTKE